MKAEKNVYVPSLSYDELSWEQAVKLLSEENEIIFVTNNDKLEGCITAGDIKRMLNENSGCRPPLKELINKNCKRIIFKNEKQALNEAEEIFKTYGTIHNVPVIDSQGKLCFQYQIESEEPKHKIYEELCQLDDENAIDNFLKWHKNRNYIIVGADEEILNLIAEFFRSKTSELEIQSKFSTCNLSNISNVNYDDFIICANNATKLFCLLTNETYQSKIIHLEEINRYAMFMFTDLDKLLKADENDIKEWMHLFGYDTIFFNSSNNYTSYLKPLMKKCGLKVYENVSKLPDRDIVMTSCKEKYIDSINITSLAFTFEVINAYHYIMGKSISRTEYINYFLFILQENRFLYKYKQLNVLDNEIYNKSKYFNEASYHIHDSKYISENAFRDRIMAGIIENCIIQKIRSFTNKIYIHILTNGDKLKVFPNRHILVEVSKKRNIDFDEKFLYEFYGDEYKNIDKIINDLLGREVVQFHSCYSKLISNYSTEYVSTNMYGDLVVPDIPEKYYGTIYLIGPCLYWGTTVPNKYTMASYLQKKLNMNGKPYRVVVFSGINGLWRRYAKIIENKINPQDIFIIMPIDFSAQIHKSNLICTDWKDLDKKIPEKNWYWDTPIHCNYHANEIISNQIYEKIERDLTEEYFPKFSLESKLENEISKYLTNIKLQLKSCFSYQNFIKEHTKKETKTGSIVMNCNPFTYGHLWLIETAARLVDLLYIFVVQEDKSEFPFQQRFLMVKEGTSHIPNVIVFPSGKVMISTDTFGGYFNKNTPGTNCYDSFLDLKIFAHYIAPELNINMRFVGEEPFDKVTAQYNKDMKVILGNEKITVIEIPRKKADNLPISATTVRNLLKERNWELISKLVPESTKSILMQEDNSDFK